MNSFIHVANSEASYSPIISAWTLTVQLSIAGSILDSVFECDMKSSGTLRVSLCHQYVKESVIRNVKM